MGILWARGHCRVYRVNVHIKNVLVLFQPNILRICVYKTPGLVGSSYMSTCTTKHVAEFTEQPGLQSEADTCHHMEDCYNYNFIAVVCVRLSMEHFVQLANDFVQGSFTESSMWLQRLV